MVMTVEKDGTVLIKVPKWTRKSAIDKFYRSNLLWIQQKRQENLQDSGEYIHLTPENISHLKKKAKAVLSLKTAYYAGIMGVEYENIKITSAKKRWGSCKRAGDKYSICYSWRTMLLENRCQDYIVVHELAHILHFNHSKLFYNEIEKVLPDWKNIEKQVDSFKDIYLY